MLVEAEKEISSIIFKLKSEEKTVSGINPRIDEKLVNNHTKALIPYLQFVCKRMNEENKKAKIFLTPAVDKELGEGNIVFITIEYIPLTQRKL